MTFQALEVMNSTAGYDKSVIDMSDYAEAERWAQAHDSSTGVGEESYDPDGDRAASQLFGVKSDSA